MAKFFNVGDHVSLRPGKGGVTGRITKVHLERFQYGGRTHAASKDFPKYEIRLDTTGDVEVHRGSALRRVKD